MTMKLAKQNDGSPANRSSCPIACTLDLIGDKWSLLIIRDIHLAGKSRYEEFLASPEKISTNILANRLKKLEEHGLITKTQYGGHSLRMKYQLTKRGKSLGKILKGMIEWGQQNIPDADPEEF
jgi:DNA-binding HxlR family transcriptional regulator